MQRAARDGVNWWVMRIVVSEHFTDTFQAVSQGWSFADQVHAHKTLDALDDIAAEGRPDPPKTRGGG